jgi:hypothetical protein
MRRLTLGLLLIPLLAAAPGDFSKSALESDPNGWMNLLKAEGKNLEGWTRDVLHAKDKLSPDNQWSLDESTGVLTCAGDKGHEWIRYEKEQGDFIYHVEWKFVPVKSGKTGYNSGIYARNSKDATTWIQAQTGNANGGFLFGEAPSRKDGKLTRFNFSKQVMGKPVKGPGEWNVFEITCKGKDITVWANGQITNEWTDCGAARGYIGLDAEGYRIEFRKVMLKPL